ncbi:uncharacterized protein [Nicotiana sylvestris]|uniref:uncharacterized protein n=1 Tax=Nicotiana sylvestris TaxID=4096 RepID=UPI00388C49F1
MANMVGQVLESHKITFHEDELPPEGLNHNRALNITLQFEDKFISRVLIDGGSSLNIYPLDTLKRLAKGFYEIRAGSMNVKAFDGSQRAMIGEINLCLQMGPTWFDIEFQVLDISASYNLLLGQTSIHAAGAGASMLHQAVKFEWNHQEDSDSEEEYEIPEEVVREVENIENKPKSNLDETEAVNSGDAETVKETRISIHLSLPEKEDGSQAAHQSNVTPVKKKLRKFKPDMSLKIKEEVTKQIKAKVLRVVEYPTWLANIVPVPKKYGKVKMESSDVFWDNMT